MEPILNIVLPVFAIIATGYLCGYFKLLGAESSEALNLFVYWVALPALLFRAIANVDLAELLNVNFLAAYVGGILAIWVAALVFARVVYGHGLANGALHGMNSVFANTGYMGIPLAITAYGEAAALPAILASVLNAALVVGLATMLLELAQTRGKGVFGALADVARSLVRNPMLVAPVLGALWAATGFALPKPVDAFTEIIGAAAGPCALFAIGLFLVGRPMSEGIGEVSVMTATKLLVQPAVTAALAFFLFPMAPMWTKVAILMAALPTGATSFVLAQAYHTYIQRTSATILITTVLSVITVSAFFVVFPPGG